ncbi:hypothetical protein [Luteipulveratus mongoliensis]|uniref:Uncharacterized protein n=1 Tax=Luteipulveratus mongoliensis TaxID=571913 RepID=A0A0K1JGR6_9MICO|nr:hypothetical protein [Luteipulveratus mongoliensis]AKU15773.1 hypothetical protein VV02_07760 [Luteipulveratus mongoliensis]
MTSTMHAAHLAALRADRDRLWGHLAQVMRETSPTSTRALLGGAAYQGACDRYQAARKESA